MALVPLPPGQCRFQATNLSYRESRVLFLVHNSRSRGRTSLSHIQLPSTSGTTASVDFQHSLTKSKILLRVINSSVMTLPTRHRHVTDTSSKRHRSVTSRNSRTSREPCGNRRTFPIGPFHSHVTVCVIKSSLLIPFMTSDCEGGSASASGLKVINQKSRIPPGFHGLPGRKISLKSNRFGHRRISLLVVNLFFCFALIDVILILKFSSFRHSHVQLFFNWRQIF